MSEKTNQYKNNFKNNYNEFRNFVYSDKIRKHFVLASIGVLGSLTIISVLNLNKTSILEVKYEDEVLGILEVSYDDFHIESNSEQFTESKNLDTLKTYITNDLNYLASTSMDGNVIVEYPGLNFNLVKNVKTSDFPINTYDEVLKNILDISDFSYSGFGIALDGEYVDALSYTEENIQTALDSILESYNTPVLDGEITSIDFLENIEIGEVVLKNNNYLDVDGFIDILQEPVIVEKTHTVVSGDSLWQIAWDNDMPLDTLLSLNPTFNEEAYLQIGDIVLLENEKPRLSTLTTEQIKYTGISYRDIETIENDEEFKNWSQIVVEGKDGESQFTENIYFTDGNEQTRKIVDEVVLVPSEKQVIEVGTLNIPPKKAIGTFIWPAQGRISDNFGTRGGNHFGMDIAVPTGTPVAAIDGGYAEFVGWQSGYGNLVIINHENGFRSYYAHNSRFQISQGERVRQGQIIASAGSTGRSSGPHIHLEIRVNGVPRNPGNYLGGSYQ